MRSVIMLSALSFLAGCVVEHHDSRPSDSRGAVYRCSMDGGERTSPGPCPKCGMRLDERHLVKKEDAPTGGGRYVCSMDGGERTSPGPCPKCGMQLDDRHLVRTEGDPPRRIVVYVRDCCGGEFAEPGSC